MRQHRMIAIRLWDWSEWCRQVVRGVQRFAHGRPDWRLFVDAGQTRAIPLEGGESAFDGIITSVLSDPRTWKRLIRDGRTKVVSITATVPRPLAAIARVQVDDAKVAEAIGRHLLAGGFRRFAYYGAMSPGVDDERGKGMLAFAEKENCPCDILEPPSGQAMPVPMPLMTRWVARLPKPVGIAAWNMDVARKIVQACQRARVEVPEQAAVVAWDDDVMLAETLEPTISAMVLPAERLGYEAASLLHRLLSGSAAPKTPLLVEPSGVLHVRQSSDVSALENREVHLALQYIREHVAEPLKVSHIASVLRISRRKFEQDFSRVTGETPYEAMVRIRLERAKQLLIETDWRIGRVAERCGMGTEQTLRRLMVQHEKMKPAEFRSRFSAP
jgi:LacI family transcriptional regulator